MLQMTHFLQIHRRSARLGFKQPLKPRQSILGHIPIALVSRPKAQRAYVYIYVYIRVIFRVGLRVFLRAGGLLGCLVGE